MEKIVREISKEKYSARSSSVTYRKNGSHVSSCRPGAVDVMAVIVSHCLMFCLFCSKKSLQTIHSLQRLAEIIEMGTGPEPISKTLLPSFFFVLLLCIAFSPSSASFTSGSTCLALQVPSPSPCCPP